MFGKKAMNHLRFAGSLVAWEDGVWPERLSQAADTDAEVETLR